MRVLQRADLLRVVLVADEKRDARLLRVRRRAAAEDHHRAKKIARTRATTRLPLTFPHPYTFLDGSAKRNLHGSSRGGACRRGDPGAATATLECAALDCFVLLAMTGLCICFELYPALPFRQA